MYSRIEQINILWIMRAQFLTAGERSQAGEEESGGGGLESEGSV